VPPRIFDRTNRMLWMNLLQEILFILSEDVAGAARMATRPGPIIGGQPARMGSCPMM
jgi:hypothetical protein